LPADQSRRLIYALLGVALVLFGLFYVVVPLIVAMVCIGIGSHLLLHNSLLARRLFIRLRRRFPGSLSFVDAWRQRRRRREARNRWGRPAARPPVRNGAVPSVRSAALAEAVMPPAQAPTEPNPTQLQG